MKKMQDNSLFDRVVLILEQARDNVVRAVNSSMVTAYWLIGREIVLELQGGEDRAEYGKQLIGNLSSQLSEKYGSGFSMTSLKYFRTFYLAYPNRLVEIGRPVGDQLSPLPKGRPVGAELVNEGFSPQLSWSHYRVLMRVAKLDARDFYERETIECGWDKRSLERQIHSHYYERMLASQNPQQMIESARREIVPRKEGIDSLKNPYVLEFLGLPEVSMLHEMQLESAIITHL